MSYISTKIFDNYSVALRQHKAQHSHCKLLHGYALSFKVWFTADNLDLMNWVVDFGGFGYNGLKEWMNTMFDHTLLIEEDDPYRELFEMMQMDGICKVHFLEKMGCESLAKLVFDKFNDTLSKQDAGRCRVIKVEVFENNKNSAIYETKN
jgi:6-pyruvoyltetrahydropterin/6-carboxytetrahydropterin synthase